MIKNEWATRAEVDQEAKGWTLAFLQCRTFRHPWQPSQARYSKRYRYYRQDLHCPRCGTIKHQEMSLTGKVLASWYTYPEGYLSGVGRIAGDAMDALRLAALKRGSVIASGEAPHSTAARSAVI